MHQKAIDFDPLTAIGSLPNNEEFILDFQGLENKLQRLEQFGKDYDKRFHLLVIVFLIRRVGIVLVLHRRT